MSLLRAFVSHEALTQRRSPRFRAMAIFYVVISTTPALLLRLFEGRFSFDIGPAGYAYAIKLVQPLLTSFLGAMISVDAITREQEEGSFTVLGLAPMSSSGYFVRRWLAVVTLCLPLTWIPPIVAWAVASRPEAISPVAPFVWDWILGILPLLILTSAAFLALGTITARLILTVFAFGVVYLIGIAYLNEALLYAGRHFEEPIRFFVPSIQDVLIASAQVRWGGSLYLPTDAPHPVQAALDGLIRGATIPAAITLLVFGLAPSFLRRTRPNVRPWRIRPDHPIVTYLRIVNRFREEFTREPVRSGADRLLLIACLVGAAILVSLYVRRQLFFERLATARYAAVTSKDPLPMSFALIPQSIQVDGHLDRSIRTRVTLVMHNSGSRPDGHLAFQLNPALHIPDVTAAGHGVRMTRRWDRVGLRLDPPLGPGGSAAIRFEIAGQPLSYEFALPLTPRFTTSYVAWRDATTTLYRSDLAQSEVHRLISESDVRLRGSDFLPVPRYSEWTDNDLDRERLVPPSLVAMRLKTPDALIADSCGSLSSAGTLTSRCSMPLNDYTLSGGRLTAMPLGDKAVFVHLPLHEEQALRHAPSLRDAVTLAAQAWPQLGGTGSQIFLNRPRSGIWEDYGPGDRASFMIRSIDSSGSLHRISELMLIQRQPLDAKVVATAVVANTLKKRRRVEPKEQAFFAKFYEMVALGRVAGGARNAVEVSPPGPPPATEPLRGISYWGRLVTRRMEKVLTAIEYRVGADAFVAGINDFSSRGPQPGSAKELLEAIGARGGVSLDRVYSDYFDGTALPKLTLSDVRFVRTSAGWQVSGTLQNLNAGEAFCPIVLRTVAGSMATTLRVDSNASVPFQFTTQHMPRVLQLDPENVCYRWVAVGTVQSVPYVGE